MKHKKFEYKKIKIESVNVFDVNTTNIIIRIQINVLLITVSQD